MDDSGILLQGDSYHSFNNKLYNSHECYQGLVKCKQLIKSIMCFPGIDAMTEASIAFYNPSQAAMDTKH